MRQWRIRHGQHERRTDADDPDDQRGNRCGEQSGHDDPDDNDLDVDDRLGLDLERLRVAILGRRGDLDPRGQPRDEHHRRCRGGNRHDTGGRNLDRVGTDLHNRRRRTRRSRLLLSEPRRLLAPSAGYFFLGFLITVVFLIAGFGVGEVISDAVYSTRVPA